MSDERFQTVLEVMPSKEAGTFDVAYWFHENHDRISAALELAERMPLPAVPAQEGGA